MHESAKMHIHESRYIFYAAFTIMEYMATFDEMRFDEVRGHHLDNIILGYIEYYNIIHIVQCFVRTGSASI